MENDESLVDTRETLAESHKNKSIYVPSLAEKDSTTTISSMGAHLGKNRGNGADEEKIDFFGGGGDDGDVFLKELSTRKNLRGVGDKESAVRGEIDGGSGKVVEGDGVTEKSESGVGDSGVESNSVGDDGGGRMSLKALARRGRRLKIEVGEGRYNNQKPSDDVLSSISRRTRYRVGTGKEEEVKDLEVVNKASEMGDEGDGEHGFSVGDFVWGKIKSHPWWPGRIFDPSTASEYALKYKHEGRLLVAYFGDGTFAWCDPSQLKPFVENFDEMSKQSSLKTFVHAVEEAVNEFGRLVELQMSCSCARKKTQSSQPLLINGGVKEGVVAPESGVEMFSVSQFEPASVLSAVRHLAKVVSVANLLELTILESRLLAFYHAKGCLLPIYYEPVGIEGLEDEDDMAMAASVQGPADGDWFVGPVDHLLTQNGPETPLDRLETRKQKTIAELLWNTKAVHGDDAGGVKGEIQSEKLAGKPGRKKRKISNEDQTVTYELNGDEADKTKDEEKIRKVVHKSRKRQKIVDEKECHVADNLIVTRSSARKKDGCARSLTTEEKTPVDKENGSRVKDPQDTVPRERKPSVSVSIEDSLIAEEGYERISPRERKKSKYLSPPYTSLQQRQRYSGLQIGSEAGGLELSDVARMGERMSKVSGKLLGSPPLAKCSTETFQKQSKASNFKPEKTDHPDNQARKGKLSSKGGDRMESISDSNHVLCEVRSAALDPQHPRSDQSFDTIKGFLSSYRSSNYQNGSNKNSHKNGMAGQRKRKRNSPDTKPGSDRKVLTQVGQQTSKLITRGRRIKRELGKSDSKGNDEVGPSTLLITFPADFSLPSKEDIIKMHRKFGQLDESKTEVVPGSSKVKIVYVKSSDAKVAMDSMQKTDPFGAAKVNYKIRHSTSGTKVNVQSKKTMKKMTSPENQEVAMESMKKSDPLETAKSDGKIQRLTSAKDLNVQNKRKTKKMKTPELQKGKSSDKHTPAAPDTQPLAVVFIKQKLESMTSMLSQTDGKMSKEIKSSLENEVKELLKRVKMMTATSSS